MAKPVEPVPCSSKALLAKLAVPDKEPVTVSWPCIVAFPVTVKDPVMYGELSIIFYFVSRAVTFADNSCIAFISIGTNTEYLTVFIVSSLPICLSSEIILGNTSSNS